MVSATLVEYREHLADRAQEHIDGLVGRSAGGSAFIRAKR